MIMSTRLTKSIRVSDQTYQELSKLGTVANSFDDVIQRLLDKGKIPLETLK